MGARVLFIWSFVLLYSQKIGGEGVRRNALRVLRPKSPHSEE